MNIAYWQNVFKVKIYLRLGYFSERRHHTVTFGTKLVVFA